MPNSGDTPPFGGYLEKNEVIFVVFLLLASAKQASKKFGGDEKQPKLLLVCDFLYRI